jgi:APA family basic amino acid/polyamine antiporter
MLVVGNVVGAGIFTTSGMLAAEVSRPAAFIGVWVLGGLITLTGALTYAELGAMFPRAGGDYQFLKEAFGPPAGFLLGWLSFWVISPGSIAALAIALVGYLPGLDLSGGVGVKVAALVVIAFLVTLNYVSTRLASAAQSIITIGSLVLLVGLVAGGAIFGEGDLDHFSRSVGGQGSAFVISGSAMIAVFFTYSGWFAAAYVGSEVVRPGRNVPLALVLGTLAVTLLYTGVNAIYLYALPMAEMRQAAVLNVAEVAAERLFGPALADAVSVAIVLAIASCINGTVMTGARVSYAMAEDGLFWSRLRDVHARFKTPHVAVVIQGVLAGILLVVGSFEALLTSVVFAMMLGSIATGVAHLRLRMTRAGEKRPYRTVGYPVVPLLFIVAYGWFAAFIAFENPSAAFFGIGLALTGLPFYLILRRLKR